MSFIASFGLAAVETVRALGNWSATDLVDTAQRALKWAKARGGNQVCGP